MPPSRNTLAPPPPVAVHLTPPPEATQLAPALPPLGPVAQLANALSSAAQLMPLGAAHLALTSLNTSRLSLPPYHRLKLRQPIRRHGLHSRRSRMKLADAAYAAHNAAATAAALVAVVTMQIIRPVPRRSPCLRSTALGSTKLTPRRLHSNDRGNASHYQLTPNSLGSARLYTAHATPRSLDTTPAALPHLLRRSLRLRSTALGSTQLTPCRLRPTKRPRRCLTYDAAHSAFARQRSAQKQLTPCCFARLDSARL